MRRDLLAAGALWMALTVLGEWAALSFDLFPRQYAAEAGVADSAFSLLLILGMPVFTFVLAGLVYSVLRFRSRGTPTEDGPPIHTNRSVTLGWFAITSALAVYVIFNPGLSGLAELAADPNPDLVVQVTAEQWEWAYTYPEYGVTLVDADELVLPMDQRVRFEITSTDVLHSFWIPGFRLKADAVPGMTNILYATPTQVGSYDDDPNVRVQCAELCGTGHPRMRTRLTILEQSEFDAWIGSLQGGGG